MESIRCPWCGDPVRVDGDRWECGYCGDFGYISSLHASERAKLDRERNRTISFRFVFDASALEDDVPDDPEPEEEPRPVGPDDRAALEEAVRRGDFIQDDDVFRDLLIAAFPQAASRWPDRELLSMDTCELLMNTGNQDPETAIQMMKLLLDTAQDHLQDPEAIDRLMGYDLYDLCVGKEAQPALLEQLKTDDRLARQLFQSAFVGPLQEQLILDCYWWREDRDLGKRLLDLLDENPFPHEPVTVT